MTSRRRRGVKTPGSADSNGRPQPLDRDARHRATRRDARPARIERRAIQPRGDPNGAVRDARPSVRSAASTAIGLGRSRRTDRIGFSRRAKTRTDRGAEDGRDGADGDARGADDDDGEAGEARKRGETTRGDAGTRERERGG